MSGGDPGELSVGRGELGRDSEELGVESGFELPTFMGFIRTLIGYGNWIGKVAIMGPSAIERL